MPQKTLGKLLDKAWFWFTDLCSAMVRRKQHKMFHILFKKQIDITLSLDQLSGSWDEDTKIPGLFVFFFFLCGFCFVLFFFLTPETSTSIWQCWHSRAFWLSGVQLFPS